MKRLLIKYVAMFVLAMMVPASIAAMTMKGSGVSGDPYLIYNPDDWAAFRDSVSQAASGTKIYARLMRNFNLKGNNVTVGTSDKPFSGEFDGNGKTISLLSVKGTSSNFGLFGYANNAVIKDLNVNGSLISEFENTGSVVGNANGATKIYNVWSSVDIYMIAERNHLGGIVGQASKTSGSTVRIKGCTYTGNMQVECSSDSNGGIVGYCEKNANVEIEYCSFRGTVSSKGDNPRVGGILGYADDDGESQNFKYIRYCFCAGTLFPSSGTYVGIFAGCPRGKVPGSITNNTYMPVTTDETDMVGNGYNSTVSASKANNAKITIKVIGSKGGLVDWEYVNPTTSSFTKVKASATPNDGCQFNNWTNGSSSTTAVSTSAIYTVDLTSSVNLFANFSNHIHTYDDGVVKTEATCVKSGLKLKTCTVAGCGYQTNSVIDAKGHGSTNGYAATYTWTGTYDAPECAFTLKCNDCKENVVDGVSLDETGGVNGRITHDAIVEPSKKTEGSQTYYGHGSYTDAINKKTYTEDGSGTGYSHKYTIPCDPRTAKAVFDATNTTMAFYYDESDHTEGVVYDLPDYQAGDKKPSWLNDSWLPVIKPTKVVIDKSMAAYPLTDLSVWFVQMGDLETIEGLEYFNTANVTDMHEMFCGCTNLTSVNTSALNTANVTDMRAMFYSCGKLEEIDLSSFDTKNVTNMSCMFAHCYALKELNLSNFATGNVTNMSSMFYYCSALKNLDLCSFNTSEVKDMSNMFGRCNKLENVNVSSFDTKKVVSMNDMFSFAWNIKKIDLSSFDTGKVSRMDNMFSNAPSCCTIYVNDKFVVNEGCITGGMFNYCLNLTGGNGTTYDSGHMNGDYARIDRGEQEKGYFTYAVLQNMTSSIANTPGMTGSDIQFTFAPAVKAVTVTEDGEVVGTIAVGDTKFALSNQSFGVHTYTFSDGTYSLIATPYEPRTAKAVFDEMSATLTFYYDDEDHSATGKVYAAPDYLNGDKEKPSWLNGSWWPRFNATKVVIDKSMMAYPATNLSVWFIHMEYMETIEGLQYLNTSGVTDMHEMFRYCKVLKSLDLSTFNTSNVTDMSNMFNECRSLETISVTPKFVVKKDTKTETMFKGCSKLVGGMGTEFNLDYTGGDYARIDRGETRPGYFTGTGPLILAGDLNGDGDVDIADLVQLVDAINNGRADSEPAADVDGDGDININDIKKLRDMILE